MSGHTPGPWSTGPSHVVRHQFRDAQDRRCTQWVAECVGMHPPGVVEANARLIAAAPDFLEALERIAGLTMSMFATKGDMAGECKRIAAEALAKATGGAA